MGGVAGMARRSFTPCALPKRQGAGAVQDAERMRQRRGFPSLTPAPVLRRSQPVEPCRAD